MKRIVLGISVLLMLVQNGFARTDAEYDRIIASNTTNLNKQIWRCNKAANNHNSTANPNICVKAISLMKKNGTFDKKEFGIPYLNLGLIYDETGDDLNGYKYYMKAARLGNIAAQKNLNIMCKESPWACK